MPLQDSQGTDSDAEALHTWLEQLGPYASADTLLRFVATPGGTIDLTHAHPSGLAQLLAGRRTRLSTLIRDRDQYTIALTAARALRAKIFELSSDRGLDVGYLAAGTASWRSPVAGSADLLTAPVLLTPVSLTMRQGQDDYELQLTEQAQLNPALVRYLEREYGISTDAAAIEQMAYSTARFDPQPVLDRLRTLMSAVRGMQVEHHLLVSTFADLEEHLRDGAIEAGSPVVRALMGRAEAAGMGGTEAPGPEAAGTRRDRPAVEPEPKLEPEPSFTPLDERDPADETLLLDADAAQQEVLDLIAAGSSLVVHAPPGTGQTQTAMNAVAALVSEGKNVLVVSERRGTLNQFVNELESMQLGSLVLQLNAKLAGDSLRDQLVRAIIRNERAAEPALKNLHQTLVAHRHQLLDHVRSLHNVRQRWGCSPYQAMQSLAELTSIHPAPATTVRLKRSVLDSITDRVELTARLRRAAELGAFSKSSWQSPWYGAKLLNRQDTEEAHGLALELVEELPQLREKMVMLADHSEISLDATFKSWGDQLELLVAIRGSLDKFTPDIFDRPVTDLISATASSSWRREHDVDMSSMTRSRLRRVAKEYIRPGVHIADLHSSLVDVQRQHSAWSEFATTQRHPSIPSGLAEINNSYQRIGKRLAAFGAMLNGTAEGGDLENLEYEHLLSRLQSLAADKQTLISLPERTLLIDDMREHGLSELLDDLSEREVEAHQVGAELELAWWQSALEAMISGDDYLAMSDGESLRQLEAEYRLADNAHISSGPSRLRWRLAQRWRSGVASRTKEAHSLRELVKSASPSISALTGESAELVHTLVPVWTASPLMIPALLEDSYRFDAVLLLDAEASSLQSALPAIARAGQVLAFGDDQLGAPQRFSVSAESATAQAAADEEPLTSALTALAQVLPERTLSTVYRSVDQDLVRHLSEKFYSGELNRLPDGQAVSGSERSLVVEYLPDGTGMPTAADHGVESVVAEVNRVVDLVFEHARTKPRSSLAVITASARHAARVGEAIRLHMPNHPVVAEFFKPGAEPFRIVPLERAAGLVRDDIIFSLGFGRTPHGRALHSFGTLSDPAGRGQFISAMTRARSRLHVLTCFRPADLDPSRLSHGALDFYELISRELPADGRDGLGGGPAADFFGQDRRQTKDDPLVADLVERLRERGARVWHHYDDVLDIVAAADPLDALLDDEDTEFPTPVAIESDGTGKYRRMSVRERSRQRPQMLERLGWRYMPLWTIEVFSDPEACTDLIGQYLGLPEAGGRKMDEPKGPNYGTSTLRDGDSALPKKATEDEASSWGEREEPRDHDQWLREQKPPHWD